MPVLAAAAAAVFSAATTFATAVGTAALASAGLGSLATMGIASFTGSLTIGTLVGAMSIGSTALSLFSAAKKPKAGAGSPSPVAWKADPNAYIPVVAGGPVGVGGNQVFAQTAGSKNRWLQYVTVLSHCGPCVSVTPFKANDEVVTFNRDGGQGAAGRYKDRFWMKNALGIIGAAATIISATGTKYVPTTNGGLPPEWNASSKLSGMAHSVTSMWADPERIPQIPKHLWEVIGGPVYDPRKDDTQPGGVGPQRWNDRTTWSTVGNTNPYLQALTFAIGHKFNGVRIAGVGVPLSMIDVPAFVNGANVCDANGWKIAWQWHTGMRKWDVFATMLQAGAGLPLVRGSQISCMVDTPRVSIGTITDADLRGDFSVTGCASIRDRKNAIVPRCKSAAHNWTVQPHGRIAPATYLAEDNGDERVVEVEFEAVADATQVRQLAALELANLREGLAAVIPVSAAFRKYRAGDCLTVNAGSTLLTGQKIVVVKREFNHKTRTVNLTVRSETDGKHAYAMGRTAEPPPSPSLVGADPTVIEPPTPGAWVPSPGQTPGGGDWTGTPGDPEAPVIVITPATPGGADESGGAADDDPAATEVVVRYRRIGVDPLTGQLYQWAQEVFPARADKLELKGLAPGVQYEVELAYKVRGITSPFTPYGVVTTGGLLATDSGGLGGRDAQAVLDNLDAVPGQIDAALAQADAALATAVGNLNLALGQLDLRTDAVEADINDPATGLIVRVGTNEQATEDVADRVTVVEQSINTPTTGLLARAASLETATANLQTGKADASRVTTLEARAFVNANLIRNPSGREGLAGWEQTGLANAFYAVEDATWGWWIRTTWAGVTPYRGLRTVPMKGGYGQSYTLSGRAFVQFPVSGTSSLRLYGYTDEAGTTGETYLTGHTFDANSTHSWPNPLPPLTATTPANIRALRVYAEVTEGADGGAYGDLGFWNLKLERGGVATLFTDDASLTGLANRASSVEARALTLETATANLQTGKADASRVTTLEAQVQAGGTGLLARTLSLETATANLQTGKADASRVTTLEARVTARPNLLLNPTGVRGFQHWSNNLGGDAGWQTGVDRDFGQWFFRPMTGQGPLNSYWGQEVAAGPGQTLVLSGERYVNGITSGNAFVEIAYFNGATYLSGAQYNVPAGAAVLDRLPDVSATSPAGTTRAVVYFGVYGAVGAPGFAYVGFYRLKLETGTVSSAFSDERTGIELAARTASLETATANLQTGKADASRVSIVEARLVRNHNLIRNPSGREGTRYWDFFNEPIVASTDLTFGPWFRHRFDNQGDHYATMRSHPFQGGYGGTWTLSGEGFQSGMGGAYCDIGVYGYTDEAGTQGEVRCSASYNTIAAHNPNVGRFQFQQQTFTAPANVITFRVWWQMRLTSPGGYSDVGIWNLKLEPGPVATVFSDDAGQSALHARVVQEESATVDLMGRTMARWAIGASVPGADAFIEARAETTPGAAPTSSVAIGARQFAVFNPLNDTWKKALDVQGGNVVLTGGLNVGAFIRLGNGQGWPVALKPVDFNASDGEPVSFGTDLGALPTLSFALNNLAPLTAGESYDVRAEPGSLSPTGFTLRAKINVPAVPSQQSVAGPGTAATVGGYPGRYVSRGALADTADGTYRVQGYGSQQHFIFGTDVPMADDESYVTSTLQVYALKGGVWQLAATVFASTVEDPSDYGGGFKGTVTAYWNLDETVTVGTGATDVALVYAGSDNGRPGAVTSLSNLSWQSQGAGSGVRSATPNGEKTRITVRPQ